MRQRGTYRETGPAAVAAGATTPGWAVAVVAVFAWYETRVAFPMLDPRLFHLASVRAGALGIIVQFFALFGLFYINAQYLQDVKGYSPLLAGVCILPLAVVMPDASARSTHLAARIGGGCGLALAPLS
jgi:hypothetical protein